MLAARRAVPAGGHARGERMGGRPRRRGRSFGQGDHRARHRDRRAGQEPARSCSTAAAASVRRSPPTRCRRWATPAWSRSPAAGAPTWRPACPSSVSRLTSPREAEPSDATGEATACADRARLGVRDQAVRSWLVRAATASAACLATRASCGGAAERSSPAAQPPRPRKRSGSSKVPLHFSFPKPSGL